MSHDPNDETTGTGTANLPKLSRGMFYGTHVCPTHATLYRTPGGSLYYRLEPRTEIRRVSHKPSAHKLEPRRRSHHRQIKRTLNRSGFITANKI